MKKTLALILALVMVLTMGIPVVASAANDDGEITIVNATIGEDYAAYKLFDLTYTAGTPTKVSYSLTKSSSTTDWYNRLIDASSPFELISTTTPNFYYGELKDKLADETVVDDEYVVNWLTDTDTFDISKKLNSEDSTPSGGATSDVVVFDDLPYGYYYVTSSVGAVVTINSTLPKVRIIDKNEGPDWDYPEDPEDPEGSDRVGKVIVDSVVHCDPDDPDSHTHSEECYYITENSANYGDTVNFSIGVDAKGYIGTEIATYYYVTDVLAEGFDGIDHDDLAVLIDGETLTENTDYTIKYSTDSKSFQVIVPTVDKETIDGKTYWKPKYGSNFMIEVKYSAKVNEDAVITEGGNLNIANYGYEKAPNDPDKPRTDDPENPKYDPETPNYPPYNPDNPPKPYDKSTEKTTTTYVYAIKILKVDPDGNPLTGAEFSVKLGDTVIKASATDQQGVYNYDPNGDTQFVVDDLGQLTIKGLKEGTYTIKEELAPQGYNKLRSTASVTADLDSYSEVTTYYDEDGKAVEQKVTGGSDLTIDVCEIEIENNSGTELPETGGMGTTLFYVFGAIMVLGAAVLLITRRRVTE